MSVLECKNLTIGYSDKVILKDINLKFEKGQYLCVVGENGCGKSTFVKTILGLIKPIKGSFKFDVKGLSLGYIPQASDFQKDFPATVKEIILSGFVGKMGWRPFYNKKEKQYVDELMRHLGIIEYANKSYKELSGGQQQKVLLARAMCASNDFLVLDEPTTGLDAKSIRTLYKTINQLNKKDSMSIIMVSHNLEQVFPDISHVLYIKKSGYFYGTKEEFMSTEDAKSVLGEEVL